MARTKKTISFAALGDACYWGATVTTILESKSDNWIPANGGTEEPFIAKNGRRLLYCWQPLTGNHAYLDCDTDIMLTDEEALQASGLLERFAVGTCARCLVPDHDTCGDSFDCTCCDGRCQHCGKRDGH